MFALLIPQKNKFKSFLKPTHCSSVMCFTRGLFKHKMCDYLETYIIPHPPAFPLSLSCQRTVIVLRSHLDWKSIFCVTVKSHSAWALVTPENCTWTRINLDLVCEMDGLRKFKNTFGGNPCRLCCFWSPSSVHFLIHKLPYPAAWALSDRLQNTALWQSDG